MKRLLILLIVVFFLTGCAWFNETYSPSESKCEQPGFKEESFICQVTAKQNTTPEALNGVLLDAAAIDSVLYPEHRLDICRVLKNARDLYDSVQNWQILTDLLIDESAKSVAIAAVLQRRINLEEYSVDKVINEYDDWFLREGWQKHWNQLSCTEFYP